MIELFTMPAKAFYPPNQTEEQHLGHFSFILYPGLVFNFPLNYPDAHTPITCVDDSFESLAFYNIGSRFVHAQNNHIHFSRVDCMERDFESYQVLSINLDTGAWMLRQPYSEPYP